MTQEQETILYSVIALASLFYNTVESFGNIHSSQNDEKDEKILLTQLGIEQARLMIWGDIVGVFSPPATLLTQPIPSQPDTTHSQFNGPRDARLDDDITRAAIDNILSGITHTLSHPSHEEMANANGLKSWHMGVAHTLDQPAVDGNRVLGLEEKYAEVMEIASSKSGIQKHSRAPTTQWVIFDTIRFANYVKFTKQQIDKLVKLLGDITDAEVERTLKADIQQLGEHPENVHGHISRKTEKDYAKLRFIAKASRGRYPGLIAEATAAMLHIETETGLRKDHAKHAWLSMPKIPDAIKSRPSSPTGEHPKRPTLLSRLSTQTFGRRSGRNTPSASRPGSPVHGDSTTPGRKSHPTTPGASRPASPGA